MTRIEQLLRQRIGLDPASIGAGSIHRAIRLRMKAVGVLSPEEYRRHLQKSPAEWTELMESVVVTETWFFRDQEPFQALVQFVQKQLSAGSTQPVRILSVPCSSGEEPYSLVMALLDAGIPAEKFQVDAADLSPRALFQARRAIYNRNSFRGKDVSFRDRYFHHTKEGYVLSPAVRTNVHFYESNILSLNFLHGKGPYDVIFCRNLLIYFDRWTQARALSAVARLLASRGLLIVGAAEQPLAFENGFTNANIPLAFACRKANAQTPSSGRQTHPVRRLALPPVPRASGAPVSTQDSSRVSESDLARLKPATGAKKIEPSVFAAPGGSAKAIPAAAPFVPTPTLAEAQRLADQGKFSEAAELCEGFLRGDATSAQGWYLLGLIRDALTDPLAVECYRKALYLNPRHYETLLQMALISEKSGDHARARTFRRRAARLKPGTAASTEAIRV